MIDFEKFLREFKKTEYYPDLVSAETILALKNFVTFLISKDIEFHRPDPLVSQPCPECGHYVVKQKKRRLDKKQVVCPECNNKFRIN